MAKLLNSALPGTKDKFESGVSITSSMMRVSAPPLVNVISYDRVVVPSLLTTVEGLTFLVTVRSIVGDRRSTDDVPPVGKDPTSVCFTCVPLEIIAMGMMGATLAAEPMMRNV